MALAENEGVGTTMLVSPTGNNNGFGGFGGDGSFWILLLFILLGGNGFGNNGGFGGNGLYPWMNQTDTINGGFRDQFLNSNIASIRDGIGNISTQLCNGFAQAEIAANSRQMADMNQNFALQSALQNCCCENRAGIADLKYTVATENCADRTQSLQNTTAIIESQNKNTQLILDKLCQQELDNLKERNISLQNQLNMATLRESQTAQNAYIAQGFANEVDALYNRLNNCPVPTTPVYGRTPIFTCQNNGCGCGCNG